jgi:hypothetical protein
MKKIIFLLALLPVLCFAQKVTTYSCQAVYFVDSVTNVKRNIVFDYKVSIDFTSNDITIHGQKTPDTFHFIDMVERDYDKEGKKLFFELKEGSYYKVMMLWYAKNKWQIIFKAENPKIDAAYFKDCTKL